MKVLITGAGGFVGKNLQQHLAERKDVEVVCFTRANTAADLPRLLEGAKAATGGALASDAGMAVAVACGVGTVIGSPVLPLLLSAARAGKPAADREELAVEATS